MPKNSPIANLLLLTGFIVAPLFGTGCIAITVGKPESISKTTPVIETASSPTSSTVQSVQPLIAKQDDALIVKLDATIRDEYPRTKHDETVTIRKKKKLSIGLFPAGAAAFLRPDDAMYTDYLSNKGRFIGMNFIAAVTFGTLWVFGTVDTLFCEPFCDFSPVYTQDDCKNQFPIGTHISIGPKAKAAMGIPKAERQKIGFYTSDDSATISGRSLGMWGLVGCFKYPLFYVDVTESPTVPYTPEIKTRHSAVRGPYEVTLEIPALPYRETQRVPSTATEAKFPVPTVPYDCNADVKVSFREVSQTFGTPGDISRQALAKARGQRFSLDVALDATRGQAVAARQSTPGQPQTAVVQSQPAGIATVPQIPAKPYDSIQKKNREDGTIEIRIKVLDTSRTFDIDRMVQPTIREIFRQEFRDNNPDCPESEIRETSKWETARDGREMVYTGGAFSLRPEMAEGTSYDAATRRGKLRLRVVGRIPPESLRDYVRRNISAIVSEKNVVLEAGKGAPPGAKYQSLGEKFEDGILTVEFEAVE